MSVEEFSGDDEVEGLIPRRRSHHHVHWVIEKEWITGVVTCAAPEGAECRLICAQGCESWPCDIEGHSLVDSGACNAIEWLGMNAELAESYVGDAHALTDGVIIPHWTGDGYTWSYPDG